MHLFIIVVWWVIKHDILKSDDVTWPSSYDILRIASHDVVRTERGVHPCPNFATTFKSLPNRHFEFDRFSFGFRPDESVPSVRAHMTSLRTNTPWRAWTHYGNNHGTQAVRRNIVIGRSEKIRFSLRLAVVSKPRRFARTSTDATRAGTPVVAIDLFPDTGRDRSSWEITPCQDKTTDDAVYDLLFTDQIIVLSIKPFPLFPSTRAFNYHDARRRYQGGVRCYYTDNTRCGLFL